MVTFYEKVHWNCKWSFEFWVFKFARVHLCCSFLLTLFPCSTMGSLPWDAVLQELLQRGTFPWVVHQECLQHGSHRQGTVHKEQTAPAWSLLHGPQLLVGCCSCTGSPWAAASSGTYPPAVAWSPPGLQGNSVVVSMVLCSSAWNISSPSFFTYIGACRVFFLVFSFLSLTAAAEHFYPLLSVL